MDHETETLWKILLGVGFVSLAGGVAAAYTDPASGYELSVYTATPVTFWIGIGIAIIVAIPASLFARQASHRVLGLVLGGGCFTAFVGLPVLRNYYFYGTADAMTHLGWARGVVAGGEEGLLSLLYPGIHTAAAFIGETTGYPITRSMLYVVALFAVVFVVFVALSAWVLTHDLRTTAIAAFSGAMLLPITNISSQLVAHPTTQAILFLPVVLYLLIRYLRSERTGLRPTAPGVILAVSLVALVFYHPQQSLNLLAMFVAIAGLQLVVRRWRSARSPIASTRPVYAQTGILAVAFALWAPGHPRFESSFGRGIERVQQVLAGEPRVGEETAQRGTSLAELGTGLLEIYLKLFGVATVYCLIAGALLLVIFAGRYDQRDGTLASFGRLQIAGFIPVTVIFLVYTLGGFGTQQFRHYGFLMAFVTLLGAIGLTRGWDSLSDRISAPVPGAALSVVLLIALAVSLATVFPSPWIYLHSQHVSEMQMDGYETGFEHTGDESEFYGVRSGPHRYADVYNKGETENKTRFRTLNETAMRTDLSERYGDGWYFSLTQLDRQQEVGAHRGLRYSSESFDAAQSQRGVNRIVDNGEFELYYVTG